MRESNTITSRRLHIWLKKGLTMSQLMSTVGIEEESEMIEVINRTSPGEAKAFIRGFRQNEKRANKKKEEPSVIQAIESKDTKHEVVHFEIPIERVQDVAIYENVQDGAQDSELMDKTQPKSSAEILNELLQEEQKYSLHLRQLEISHKKCMQERLRILKELQDVKEKIESILENLYSLKEKMNTLHTEYDALAEEMVGYNDDIASTGEILDVLRAQIKSMNTVDIFVYEDGTFESSRGDLAFSEVDEAQCFAELVNMPEASEMTIKELRTCARLHAMLKVLSETGVEYSIAFDSQKLQEFFDSFR